jgi:hypothetical protein
VYCEHFCCDPWCSQYAGFTVLRIIKLFLDPAVLAALEPELYYQNKHDKFKDVLGTGSNAIIPSITFFYSIANPQNTDAAKAAKSFKDLNLIDALPDLKAGLCTPEIKELFAGRANEKKYDELCR